ncbi:putative phytosulfokine 6 [Capsicum galapagoense]
MEQKNILFLLTLMVLLISHTTSARLLSTTTLQVNKKFFTGASNPISSSQDEDFNEVMGAEECKENDEKCLKRRMVAEAHLDYIYTQHKPKP